MNCFASPACHSLSSCSRPLGAALKDRKGVTEVPGARQWAPQPRPGVLVPGVLVSCASFKKELTLEMIFYKTKQMEGEHFFC